MNDDRAATGELTFAEFPPATRAQWLALAAAAQGALAPRSCEGIAVLPLYGRDRQARIVEGRALGAPWRIVQRIEHPDPAAAAGQARVDASNGAGALALVLAGAVGAYGFGLPSPGAAVRALEGLPVDGGLSDGRLAIDLQAGPQTADAARALTAALARRGVAPGAASLAFGFDPIGDIAAGAAPASSWRDGGRGLAAAASDLSERGWKGPFAAADGRVIHNAGGSAPQELAFVLAAAIAYLRALEAGGIALSEARRMVYFRVAADAGQFLTIAKFRALRRLWARVEALCALANAPIVIAAETAWRMMTRCDPHVNILRATAAVLAAGLGGADAVAVLPHTAAIGLPDEAARRIARNTQLIFLEEAHLAGTADPAAGSGALEGLTGELCAAAWSLFQELERAGGAAAALERGLVQARVAAVRAGREAALARRQDVLTGTSTFADLAEAPSGVLAPWPAPGAGARGRGAAALPCRRLAEPFEALREATERVRRQTGVRPQVFLANLGQPADFSAPAAFARDFFEAGGIAALTNDGFENDEGMLDAFEASGARLACLCGSDAVYAARAAGAAKALRRAGAAEVCLAGRPGPAALAAAGVRTFVYHGCDALAVLEALVGTRQAAPRPTA